MVFLKFGAKLQQNFDIRKFFFRKMKLKYQKFCIYLIFKYLQFDLWICNRFVKICNFDKLLIYNTLQLLQILYYKFTKFLLYKKKM